MHVYGRSKSESWTVRGLASALKMVVFQDQRRDIEMNKAELIKQIVASLTESLGVLEKAARAVDGSEDGTQSGRLRTVRVSSR